MSSLGSSRETALGVLRTLRQAGFEAYFVGGAVRDEILKRPVGDYDIATSAHPPQVRALFPKTVAIGAQFGVVVVIEDRQHVEVATFRSDGAYVDGRRPTDVTFGSPEEDAQRRDFTVNALMLDPETGTLLDFVGGQADLAAGLLRAIGDPSARFAEDKLRMLRAVRFAATHGFTLDPATRQAVEEHAGDIQVVSWERIRAELDKILLSGRSAMGLRMLHEVGLLEPILPELAAMDGVAQPPQFHKGDVWFHTLLAMQQFDGSEPRTLELALATLLHDVGKPGTFQVLDRIRFNGHDSLGAEMAETILRRLCYPRKLIQHVVELVRRHMAFVQIREWRPAKVKRFVLAPLAEDHLHLHRLDVLASNGDLSTWEWMHEQRKSALAEPPPAVRLVTGTDLLAAGYPPGPQIGKALALLSDEILEGRVKTREEGLLWLARHPPPQ